MPGAADSQVGAGFEAMAAGDWPTARDAFEAVLQSAEVPEALVGLASASYWLADLTVMMQSLERAHAAARRAAIRSSPLVPRWRWLATTSSSSATPPRRRVGWPEPPGSSRPTRHSCGESFSAARSFLTDDPAEAERLAREVVDIGRAEGNTDLELLGMTAVGAAMVQQGRMADGLAMLDEVMAAAIGGECDSPLTAAHASCMTMLVCASYFDIERATQWVQAMDRFIGRYGCPFLDAECRTNYGRVLFENGDWAVAVEVPDRGDRDDRRDDSGVGRAGVGHAGRAAARAGTARRRRPRAGRSGRPR